MERNKHNNFYESAMMISLDPDFMLLCSRTPFKQPSLLLEKTIKTLSLMKMMETCILDRVQGSITFVVCLTSFLDTDEDNVM